MGESTSKSSMADTIKTLTADKEPLLVSHMNSRFVLSVVSGGTDEFNLRDSLVADRPIRLKREQLNDVLDRRYGIKQGDKSFKVLRVADLKAHASIEPQLESLKNIGAIDYFTEGGIVVSSIKGILDNMPEGLHFRAQDFLRTLDTGFISEEHLREVVQVQQTYREKFGHEPIKQPVVDVDHIWPTEREIAYWQDVSEVFAEVKPGESIRPQLNRKIMDKQIDYLLGDMTRQFPDAEQKRTQWLEQAREGVLRTYSHLEEAAEGGRGALMWIQTMVDLAHGHISGAATMAALEAYQHLVAPALEKNLDQLLVSLDMSGVAGFRSVLQIGIRRGVGGIFAVIPIGRGIIKMYGSTPGSIEHKAGELEAGMGIAMLTSFLLLTGPIGFVADLAILAGSTIASGELTLEQLERDEHIKLEHNFRNRVLLGLEWEPEKLKAILEQTWIHRLIMSAAERIFQELIAHGSEDSTAPVLVYCWPISDAPKWVDLDEQGVEYDRLMEQEKDRYKQLLHSGVHTVVGGQSWLEYQKCSVSLQPCDFTLNIRQNVPEKASAVPLFPMVLDTAKYTYLHAPTLVQPPATGSGDRDFPSSFVLADDTVNCAAYIQKERLQGICTLDPIECTAR